MAEARVERRLAAILAGDVAGYSRLMGADEEGTLARLNAHRRDLLEPKIAEHRGRIVKRTGDGVLTEFASAVDATRCALEIQSGMNKRNKSVPPDQRIELRIGIHVGDIILEEGDIFGDGVNIAARLENLAMPGGLCISDDAYRQIRGKIDADFQDMGERELKNIAQPVRVYKLQSEMVAVAEGASATNLPLPDRPSIAVLPFQNMSGDPEQEYFADGMVEEIITSLARIKWLFVIARNSSFAYKGKSPDIRQVGRELGVRYVLEGSVRKAGNRIRITGQLIEAATGRHLWVERYDRALDDIFALQDEITLNVVGAIEPSLRHAELERTKRKRPDSLDAYDLYLQAFAISLGRTSEDHTKALALLEQVVSLEPDYIGAHALMADCYRGRFLRGTGQIADRDAALVHAHAELAAGCDDATALAMVGLVILTFGQNNAAAHEIFERAIQISPSSMLALGYSALELVWSREFKLAIERAEQARRLSPIDPWLVTPNVALAQANFHLGRYEEAAAAARRATEVNPSFTLAFALLAAALIRLGQAEEAKSATQRVQADPHFQFQRLPRQEVWAPVIAAYRDAVGN